MQKARISTIAESSLVSDSIPTEPKYSSFEDFLAKQTAEASIQLAEAADFRESYLTNPRYYATFADIADNGTYNDVIPKGDLDVLDFTKKVYLESESARRLHDFFLFLKFDPSSGYLLRNFSNAKHVKKILNLQFLKGESESLGYHMESGSKNKSDVVVYIPDSYDEEDLFVPWIVGDALSDGFPHEREAYFNTFLHELHHYSTHKAFKVLFGKKMHDIEYTPALCFLDECLSRIPENEYGLSTTETFNFQKSKGQSIETYSPILTHLQDCDSYSEVKELSVADTHGVEFKIRVLSELGVPSSEIPNLVFGSCVSSKINPKKLTLEAVGLFLNNLISQQLQVLGVAPLHNFQLENTDFADVSFWLNKKYSLRQVKRKNAFFKALKPRFDLLVGEDEMIPGGRGGDSLFIHYIPLEGKQAIELVVGVGPNTLYGEVSVMYHAITLSLDNSDNNRILRHSSVVEPEFSTDKMILLVKESEVYKKLYAGRKIVLERIVDQ